MADNASKLGKSFCVSHISVGSDTVSIREAVVEVMKLKGIAVMVFSKDEMRNKVFVCAGVPEKDGNYKQLNVEEWLESVLDSINGKDGVKKGRLAECHGSDAFRIDEAMDVAESFAATKLT